MTALSRKVWNFCEQFLRFFWKNDPSQAVAIARIAPKICQGQPPHLAHIVPDQISSKLVHFWWSYFWTREERFCPVEYLQYNLFEPRTSNKWLVLRFCRLIINIVINLRICSCFFSVINILLASPNRSLKGNISVWHTDRRADEIFMAVSRCVYPCHADACYNWVCKPAVKWLNCGTNRFVRDTGHTTSSSCGTSRQRYFHTLLYQHVTHRRRHRPCSHTLQCTTSLDDAVAP